MVGYSAIEKAVRDRIRAHFGPLLTEETCLVADLDNVFDGIMREDRDLGCVVDFGGGTRSQGAPFTKQMWSWRIGCFLMVRYRGDPVLVDKLARDVIDKFYTVFEDDHTLGGVSQFVKIERIDQPEAGDINDVPFYWIYAEIEAFDK